MEFKTQYTPHARKFSTAGNPIKKKFTGFYNERGQVELKEDGEENLYDYIQSFKESTDINLIVRRFASGETDVLEKVQGFYGDVTGMPDTYAGVLQHLADSERIFASLPVDTRARFGHSFGEFLAASNDANFLERLGIEAPKINGNPIPAIPVVPGDPVKEVVTE